MALYLNFALSLQYIDSKKIFVSVKFFYEKNLPPGLPLRFFRLN